MENTNRAPNETSSLTSALRFAGVGLLVASGVIFMLQGVWALSSFERFLSFGGLAAGLGLLGIAAGTRFREPKTARVFLGLAAAATPVLYSQLGAIVHAGFYDTPTSFPSALQVAAPSFLAGTISVIVTTVLMVPLLYLGFAAFYRQRAKEYVGLMLLGCGLLLIPSRDPMVASTLLLFSTLTLTAYTLRASEDRDPVGSIEKWVAGMLPLIPVGVLIGRALFYQGSHAFQGSCLLFGSALCLAILPNLSRSDKSEKLLFTPGVFFAAGAWYFYALTATQLLGLGHGVGPMFMFYVPAVAMMVVGNRKPGRLVVATAGMLGAFAVPIVTAVTGWTMEVAMTMAVFGVATSVIGFKTRGSAVFVNGILVGLLGCAFFAERAASYAYAAPWVSLAFLGVAVIVLAGWIEKNHSRMGDWADSARGHFDLGPALSSEEKR
jgi:hypothetical protein